VLTRRKAIALGGGSAALLVAGCGGRPPRKLAGSAADLPFLAAALEVERAQVALYEAAIRSLQGEQAALARKLLGHERAHAAAVAEAIGELGGRPAPSRPRAFYERGLPEGADGRAWVRAAIEREQAAVDAYAGAIPKLANGRLKSTFGAIMTSEAEHAAALGVTS
jgi:rubrerythrin